MVTLLLSEEDKRESSSWISEWKLLPDLKRCRLGDFSLSEKFQNIKKTIKSFTVYTSSFDLLDWEHLGKGLKEDIRFLNVRREKTKHWFQ